MIAISILVVDDMLDGLNEWRNIQDIVRNTFKALHELVKAQGEAIRNLERFSYSFIFCDILHNVQTVKTSTGNLNKRPAKLMFNRVLIEVVGLGFFLF